MAGRLLIWTGGIISFCYVGSFVFAQRDQEVQQILKDKRYGDDISAADRKKAQFMSVLEHAATGKKAMYRQSKEEIERSLPTQK